MTLVLQIRSMDLVNEIFLTNLNSFAVLLFKLSLESP